MLGQSIRRFTTSVVRRSHYEEGPGKNIPFSVENKWRLLAMMTLFFGSGFAAPFFIVKDLRRVSSLRGDPSQGAARPLTYGCKQQEVYSDTQVPGATKSLGRLARPTFGARYIYGVGEREARLQKREAWLQGFHWLV
uniref:Cytochrome c oxidase subunit 7C, mitochondrial n=1 Tax=Moschus moschiferus TaxID=68415 RepID=A0A8C6FHC5_MOSMO